MYGFEYGVYAPGDLARLVNEEHYREIESYNYLTVKFKGGATALVEEVVEVIMTGATR